MSAFGFLGGLGGAYTNVRRGMDQEQARMEHDEDRAALAEQRADAKLARAAALKEADFRAGQRQRLESEQKLADATRDELAAVAPAGEVDLNKTNPQTSQITVDNEGTPSATQLPAVKNRTYDQVMREQAAVLRKNKQSDKAFELESAADKIAFGRAAARFQQVAAGNSDLQTTARQIGEIFDADPNNGGVKAVEEIPGGVRITLVNKDTGITDTREFTGPQARQQLVDAFSAYYSPETWAKLQAEAQKMRMEVLKEQAKEGAKSRIVPGGATLVRPDGTTLHVPKEFDPYRGTGSGSGSGSGGGKQDKPPPSPRDQANAIFATASQKGETKLEPQQIADGARALEQLYAQNPEIPPAAGANLALGIATGKVVPTTRLDNNTGRFYSSVTDGDTEYRLRDVSSPGQVDGMQARVKSMLEQQGDKAQQSAYLAAAHGDAAARARLIEGARANVQERMNQLREKNPSQAALIEQNAPAALAEMTADIDRKLALIKANLPKPKDAPKPPSRLTVGGIRDMRIPGQTSAGDLMSSVQRYLNQ